CSSSLGSSRARAHRNPSEPHRPSVSPFRAQEIPEWSDTSGTTMDERPGGGSGRSAALRDLLWILLAVLFLLVLGSATRLFEPFYDWVGERLRGQVGEAFGALLLLAAGARGF